ncbi:hypothetical protein [Caldibacillus debilis]|uniref:hypothetical protein n=1 Tax=Caldibacillus debilis TaxID=301148 RepID=UPI00039D8C9A|nr:hypothetical protein [Caldibacillus debilis]
MNPSIDKNMAKRNRFFKEPLFAKYPAAGQGERCRHKDNGKPADMAVVGKTEAKTGSEPKTTVSWTPVLKLKNTNEKAAIPFLRTVPFFAVSFPGKK